MISSCTLGHIFRRLMSGQIRQNMTQQVTISLQLFSLVKYIFCVSVSCLPIYLTMFLGKRKFYMNSIIQRLIDHVLIHKNINHNIHFFSTIQTPRSGLKKKVQPRVLRLTLGFLDVIDDLSTENDFLHFLFMNYYLINDFLTKNFVLFYKLQCFKIMTLRYVT